MGTPDFIFYKLSITHTLGLDAGSSVDVFSFFSISESVWTWRKRKNCGKVGRKVKFGEVITDTRKVTNDKKKSRATGCVYIRMDRSVESGRVRNLSSYIYRLL